MEEVKLTDLNVIAWLILSGETPTTCRNEVGRIFFLFKKTERVNQLLGSYHTARVSVTDYVEAQRKTRSMLFIAKGGGYHG
jgi:hypothetical protein